MQDASKLDYFYCLVAMAPDSHIENPGTSGQPLFCRVFEVHTGRFVVSLALDKAIPTPRSGHFIQIASKLDYFFMVL
jgi:hypothetical protein